jgi:hypothetical protein
MQNISVAFEIFSHIVSGQGIEVDSDKVNCILALEFPRNISELRSFLGLVSYYRAFCSNFASKAEPLTECLRKNMSLQWTQRRQQAFDDLKTFLVSSPVLSTPRDEGQYVLDVDSSLVGAGACLQQWQEGQCKVIAYASRTFNKAERSYCVTRREMAALIFGLKRFRQFLLGTKFICRTDHAALIHYRRTPEPVGQQCRYLDFVAQFDMDLQYRPGSKHSNADSLSRLRPCEEENGGPCRQCNRQVTGRHGNVQEGVRRVQTRAERRREIEGTPKVMVSDSSSPSADSWHPTGTAAGSVSRESRHTGLI